MVNKSFSLHALCFQTHCLWESKKFKIEKKPFVLFIQKNKIVRQRTQSPTALAPPRCTSTPGTTSTPAPLSDCAIPLPGFLPSSAQPPQAPLHDTPQVNTTFQAKQRMFTNMLKLEVLKNYSIEPTRCRISAIKVFYCLSKYFFQIVRKYFFLCAFCILHFV